MTFEQTVQLITVIVAAYGALLSTYVFIVQRLDKRKHVKVSLSMGFLVFAPNLSDTQLLLQAANAGHRTVTLTGWCVRPPGNEQILMPMSNSNPTFPCELADGKSATCWLEAKEVAMLLYNKGYRGTVRLRGEVRDATENFRSKPMKFSIEDWLRN